MVLEGKTALVTGAGQGIGKAIALQLARDGADVAVADINADSGKQTCDEIEALGRRSASIQADIGNLDEINRVLAETVQAFGGIDILVNNAAITGHIQILDITEADWDSIHRVNAKGSFFCMQRAAKHMIEQNRGGRIINMASVAGQGYSGTSNAAYAASKGAVIAMTRIAAHSFGSYGINVNAICPGVTDTLMLDSIIAKRSNDLGIPVAELRHRAEEGIPIRRMSEVDDIAAMAAFLAGPGGKNITGQCLNVDGGLIMH